MSSGLELTLQMYLCKERKLENDRIVSGNEPEWRSSLFTYMAIGPQNFGKNLDLEESL